MVDLKVIYGNIPLPKGGKTFPSQKGPGWGS